MRASLVDPLVFVQPRDAWSRSRPPSTRFSIWKCVSAYAAICGRCVMQSTWNADPSAAQLRADDVGDPPADAGVDLVEDQPGATRSAAGRRRR